MCSTICQRNARRKSIEEFRQKVIALVHALGLHKPKEGPNGRGNEDRYRFAS